MGATPICPKCGKEEIPVCPICGKKVDVYSRIVGYLTSLSHWNPGKQQEMKERTEFSNFAGEDLANREEFALRKQVEHQRGE